MINAEAVSRGDAEIGEYLRLFPKVLVTYSASPRLTASALIISLARCLLLNKKHKEKNNEYKI